MASLVLGWRMPYLLSCFNVTGQSMLVPNEIALITPVMMYMATIRYVPVCVVALSVREFTTLIA